MSEKETIEVQRRRKGDGLDDGTRAQAPSKKQPSGGPPSGGKPPGSRPPTGQRPTSGRGMKLPLWLAVPLVILVVLFNLFSGGGEDSNLVDEAPLQEELVIDSLPTSEPVEFDVPPVSSKDQTWLVMLYQDADDKILEEDIYIDLNEAERVGSTDRVHIVAQVDRYQAGFSGDGDWDSTRRYYVTKDDDLNKIDSHLVQDLGEVNMADGQALVDFVTWAVSNYPADRYALILSDHGMGWPGGWSDPSPGGKDANSAPLAKKLGEHLFLSEIDHALGDIRQQTGLAKFDIVGFDACLMAQLEVFSAIQPHAYYAIASEETEPSLGWAYTGFMQALTQNPDMEGAELSRLVVESYIKDDQRIVDPVARENFVSQGSPLAALFGFGRTTSDQLNQQLGRDATLSAVDLMMLPRLMENMNEFALALQDEDQAVIATARTYARSYTSIFGREVPPSFIDLGHFIQLVSRESEKSAVQSAANDVLLALGEAVIAEKHGSGKNGSSGMTIYFPNSTLYRSPMAGPQSYTEIASRFAEYSLWDDFLAFHYHDRPFDGKLAQPYIPSNDAPTRAPGQGEISVSPISVSSEVATPGNPINFELEISGENLGYIKLFVGYYDQVSNSIFYADTDYLESPETRELDGIYYPKWLDEETFTLSFSWDPYIFGISDGDKVIPALFSPQIYGAKAEDAVYTVDGIYSFVGGSDTRNARLYFRDGVLQHVYGFTGQDDVGAPREIIPKSGDSFTLIDQWIDLDSEGNIIGKSHLPGETLTFTDDTFRWDEIYASPGVYFIGFIIEDLDGNAFPVYTKVTVE